MDMIASYAEYIIGSIIIEFAISGIIILICRRFGWNIPLSKWAILNWFITRINNMINPDPKRLDKFAAVFG